MPGSPSYCVTWTWPSGSIDRDARRVDGAVARAEVRPVPGEDGERVVERRAAVFLGFGVLDRTRRHDEVAPAVLDLLGHDEIDRVHERPELDLTLTAAADRVHERLLPAVLEHLLQRHDLVEASRARDDDVEGHAARARGRADRRRRRVFGLGFLLLLPEEGRGEQQQGEKRDASVELVPHSGLLRGRMFSLKTSPSGPAYSKSSGSRAAAWSSSLR